MDLMIVRKTAGLSLIFILLSLIVMPGCAINDAITKAINNPNNTKADKNERLFLDGMISAYEEDYDTAYELFGQIDKSHHLYLVARKEMAEIDRMSAQPQPQPQAASKPVKKTISSRKLNEYKKLMSEARAHADKQEYELAYFSYYRASKVVSSDEALSNIVQRRKGEMEPQALSSIQTKLQKAEALDQKYEFQEIIDMLRPIAQVPLKSKEVQESLASALHKLALVNYQQSKYKTAADLFEEEYQYRPEKSVKELSEKARKLSEALESN